MPDATTRAIAWLVAWDAQAIRRTGTVGDGASADWVIREAAGIDAAPEVKKFALDRLDPIDAYLERDGVRIPGAAVFDAPATVGDGVVGILDPVGAETLSGVAELSALGIYAQTTKSCIVIRRIAGLVVSARAHGPALRC